MLQGLNTVKIITLIGEARGASSKLSRDPKVLEGSSIVVTKQPAERPKERKEFDRGSTIKDSFAIMASAATIICLTSQVKK